MKHVPFCSKVHVRAKSVRVELCILFDRPASEGRHSHEMSICLTRVLRHVLT